MYMQISSVRGLSQFEFRAVTTSISDKACISKQKSCIVSISSILPTGGSNAFVEYSQPALPSCSKSCASGPHYVEHYKPGYFYWPQIRYKSCDGMTCGYKRRCIPTRSRQQCHTVCVYKCGGSGCTFIGIQYVTYTEHLACQCECVGPENCSRGYVWNTKECRCIKNYYYCLPHFYYSRNFHRCLPLY